MNIKDVYVGHTTDFNRQKRQHKPRCINESTSQYNVNVYRTVRDNGGWDNWAMIEIEKFPCRDKNEAVARE